MNCVEVWVANNPNEIKPDVDRFCERHGYNPVNISITYDTHAKCYVAIGVLEKI